MESVAALPWNGWPDWRGISGQFAVESVAAFAWNWWPLCRGIRSQWKPEVEVFKDAPHIARSSEQLTLLSLTRVSLADLIAKAQKAQPGTVYSVTPGIKQHKPVAQVLVANGRKVTELTYNLLNGALMDTRHQ